MKEVNICDLEIGDIFSKKEMNGIVIKKGISFFYSHNYVVVHIVLKEDYELYEKGEHWKRKLYEHENLMVNKR